MKLHKVLCCMFLLSVLALTVHKTQKLFQFRTEELTNKNILVT